jgi:hypothetical protein
VLLCWLSWAPAEPAHLSVQRRFDRRLPSSALDAAEKIPPEATHRDTALVLSGSP